MEVSLSQICCKTIIQYILEGKLKNVNFKFTESMSNSIASYALTNVHKGTPEVREEIPKNLNISKMVVDMEYLKKENLQLL